MKLLLPLPLLRIYLITGLAATALATPSCGGSSNAVQTTQTNLVNGHLVGLWGASDTNAGLQMTSSGGQLTLYCGWGGPLSQPIVPDTSGHFDVPGIYNSTVPNMPARYTGTVSGNTLKLTILIVYPGVPVQTEGTYTLTAGHQPPSTSPYGDGCPG